MMEDIFDIFHPNTKRTLQKVMRDMATEFGRIRSLAARLDENASDDLVQIFKRPDHYMVYADLAGFKKECIDVFVTSEGILKLRAKGESSISCELQLPSDAIFDSTQHSATMTDGVLMIKVPRQQNAELNTENARRIPIL